jgi:hypothetical protein
MTNSAPVHERDSTFNNPGNTVMQIRYDRPKTETSRPETENHKILSADLISNPTKDLKNKLFEMSKTMSAMASEANFPDHGCRVIQDLKNEFQDLTLKKPLFETFQEMKIDNQSTQKQVPELGESRLEPKPGGWTPPVAVNIPKGIVENGSLQCKPIASHCAFSLDSQSQSPKASDPKSIKLAKLTCDCAETEAEIKTEIKSAVPKGPTTLKSPSNKSRKRKGQRLRRKLAQNKKTKRPESLLGNPRLIEGKIKLAKIPENEAANDKKVFKPMLCTKKLRLKHRRAMMNQMQKTDEIYQKNLENTSQYSDSIIFDKNEFQRLNHLYGPVDIDGAASIENKMVPIFCSKENSFFDTDIKGKTVWLNPPFKDALQFVLKFEEQRKQSPENTKALIVLPELGYGKTPWKNIVRKYTKIHVYPAGTYLFSVPSNTNPFETKPLGPTPWPIAIYLADNTVQSREAQSIQAATLYAQDKHLNKNIKVFDPQNQKSLIHLTSHTTDDLLILQTNLKDPNQSKIRLLIDSGASRDFISKSLTANLKLECTKLQQTLKVALADGTTTTVTEEVQLSVPLGSTTYKIPMIVVEMNSEFDCILGISWLTKYNPYINWQNKTIRLDTGEEIQTTIKPREVQLNIITANSLKRLIQKQKYSALYLTTIEQISTEPKPEQKLLNSIKSDFGPEFTEQIKTILAKFDLTETLTELPPSRGNYDHRIPFKPNATPPSGRIYKMSPAELDELNKQLKTYLEKHWIRGSDSQFAAPILFAKKADGSLRMCVDYRGLNKITRRSAYPLPLIDNMLDVLAGAKCFSKLDLAQGYHQIRMYEPDIHKTAFNCQFGQFEFCVMPFGLSGAPGTFQRIMNNIFKEYINKFVMVYMDDILIYSPSLELHLNHLNQVLTTLKQNKFYLRIDKCAFGLKEIEYLGHIVNQNGIKPTQKKIKAVMDWPIPTNITELRQFLGFTNYYRKHIKHYSEYCKPFYDLLKNNSTEKWSDLHKRNFKHLKQSLCKAPLLMLPKTGNTATFVVATDASKYAAGAVLLQEDNNQQLRPIAYFAKTFNDAQQRYPTYDQELLALICALQEWRHYLEGCAHFTVLTDHITLKHLPQQGNISRRHAAWIQILSPFLNNTMTILYKKGDQNQADALSRRPDLQAKLERFWDTEFENELDKFTDFIGSQTTITFDENLLNQIRQSYSIDPKYSGNTLPPGVHKDNQNNLYKMADKICIPNNIEIKNKIISECHNNKTTGHFDANRTENLIKRNFWWLKMSHNIRKYVKNCEVCQLIKPSTQQPMTSLQPLPIPTRPWEYFSMDFITNLPEIDGFDTIVTFVDLFTKQAHFIPCNAKINAHQLAKLYIENIYKLHGLSKVMVGDRDSKYTSTYWQEVFKALGTKLNLSTAYHPQTDGQSERTNRTIEQILRAFVYNEHQAWLRHLPLAEFAYNNIINTSTKVSPFYALYGYNPYTPISLCQPSFEIDLTSKIQEIHEMITDNLKIAKEYQKYYSNKRHSEPIQFEIGQKVKLLTTNLKINDQPSSKFKQRFLGPFQIESKITDQVYKLKLPDTMKCHPIFHISKLRPWFSETESTTNTSQTIAKTEYEIEVHMIDKITDFAIGPHPRYSKGPTLLFKVHWIDESETNDTWEPYILVKQLNAYKEFIQTNKNWQIFKNNEIFKTMLQMYPARMPSSP